MAARASKAKKQRRQKSEQSRNKISKADTTRGARPGLLPTSGPRAKVSSKKARKLEKKMGYAIKRKMDAEGIVEMKGKLAPSLGRLREKSLWTCVANHCVLVDAPEIEDEAQQEGGETVDMEIQ